MAAMMAAAAAAAGGVGAGGGNDLSGDDREAADLEVVPSAAYHIIRWRAAWRVL
jgi:hypothetical protein